MKMSDMIPLGQDIEQARRVYPAFRQTWDTAAFARAVATEVVRYRAERDLTQEQLAEITGLTQPQVAKLEVGEDAPTLKMLAKVSIATGLEFRVDVSGGAAHLVDA